MKRRQMLILLAHTTSLPARSQAPTLTADTCSSRLLLLSVPGRNAVPVSLVHQLVNHADDCQSTDAIVKRRCVRFIAEGISWQNSSSAKRWPSLGFALPSSYSSFFQLCSGEVEGLGPCASCPCSSELCETEILQLCCKKKKKYKFHLNYCSAFQHINAHFLHAPVYTADLPQPQPALPGITHVLLFFSAMML